MKIVFIKNVIMLAVASMALVSCAPEKEEATEKKYKRPTVSIEQFNHLLSTDKQALARKAQAKDLGACTIVRYDDDTGDSSGKYCQNWIKPYAVYLRDLKLYYPDMTKKPVNSGFLGCHAGEVREYVWQALNDGFCYKVNR